MTVLPVIDFQPISQLPKVAAGEEAAVYLDETQDAVYKITPVEAGYAGKGRMAATLVDDQGRIWLDDPQPITLAQHLFRLAHQNQHGRFVWTELVGLTQDGDLITKQPFVPELAPCIDLEQAMRGGITDADLLAGRQALMSLGLMPLASISETLGSFVAVGYAGSTPILVDDLHGFNLMRTPDGRIYIVDAMTRVLKPGEAQLPTISAALEASRTTDKEEE